MSPYGEKMRGHPDFKLSREDPRGVFVATTDGKRSSFIPDEAFRWAREDRSLEPWRRRPANVARRALGLPERRALGLSR